MFDSANYMIRLPKLKDLPQRPIWFSLLTSEKHLQTLFR